MNTNLCLVSYYGAIEPIKSAENSLSKVGFNVFDFPLFKYMNDVNDKVDDYFDMFTQFIKENNIKYVLWWYINIPLEQFYVLKDKTDVKYLFFNWDEPFNWDDCLLKYRSFYLDTVFVTCSETLGRYVDNGVSKSVCLYPGFNETYNHRIEKTDYIEFQKYDCDISICCTNLYADENIYPDQYINRKELIDDIYNNQIKYGYIFYIYGPKVFGELYPKSYKGFVEYTDLNKVFNYSKINLCTHVIHNQDGYLNERMFLMGASYGLILVDPVKGIEKIFVPNKDVIILEKDNYIQQIKNILTNYKHYRKIRHNIGTKCYQKYTYDKWAKIIYDNVVV